jgi:hypothetical protein
MPPVIGTLVLATIRVSQGKKFVGSAHNIRRNNSKAKEEIKKQTVLEVVVKRGARTS